MIERLEELKILARHYGELRLQVIADLKKINDYSLTLFKAFLEYAEKRKRENLEPHILLNEFLNALALDRDEDRGTRASLARRFYKLAEKHVRNPKEQASILQYLEY
jgi:hypothetical protein